MEPGSPRPLTRGGVAFAYGLAHLVRGLGRAEPAEGLCNSQWPKRASARIGGRVIA